MFQFLFVGHIPTLEEIWFLGDVFLSFAAQHFNSIVRECKIQRSDNFYAVERFDTKFLFTPTASTGNVLLWLQSALAAEINNTIRLPRFIVILDKDFTKLGNCQFSDIALKALICNVITDVQKWKEQLPQNVVRQLEPKIIFAKPTSKMGLMDINGDNAILKKYFNRSLEKITCKYKNIFAVNIDSIKPDDSSMYKSETSRSLSVKGYETLWIELDNKIQAIDKGK